jgi:hypothetical protein
VGHVANGDYRLTFGVAASVAGLTVVVFALGFVPWHDGGHAGAEKKPGPAAHEDAANLTS